MQSKSSDGMALGPGGYRPQSQFVQVPPGAHVTHTTDEVQVVDENGNIVHRAPRSQDAGEAPRIHGGYHGPHSLSAAKMGRPTDNGPVLTPEGPRPRDRVFPVPPGGHVEFTDDEVLVIDKDGKVVHRTPREDL